MTDPPAAANDPPPAATPTDAKPTDAAPAQVIPPRPVDARGAAGWVLGGLAVWGIVLALGAALFQPSVDEGITLSFRPMRGLLVLVCVGAFMGFWGLLLRRRPRRTN